MSKREIDEMVAYHKRQAELNRGKAERANERACFHERTVVALLAARRAS